MPGLQFRSNPPYKRKRKRFEARIGGVAVKHERIISSIAVRRRGGLTILEKSSIKKMLNKEASRASFLKLAAFYLPEREKYLRITRFCRKKDETKIGPSGEGGKKGCTRGLLYRFRVFIQKRE